MRERLSLVVFLTISRRFHASLPPASASQLSTYMKVPAQLLNECLNRLMDMQLIGSLRSAPGAPVTDPLYQPIRPLNKINLRDSSAAGGQPRRRSDRPRARTHRPHRPALQRRHGKSRGPGLFPKKASSSSSRSMNLTSRGRRSPWVSPAGIGAYFALATHHGRPSVAGFPSMISWIQRYFQHHFRWGFLR